MQRLKAMKENLISCVQSEMGHLKEVDSKELGEAIDMIKDLEEAIYYATITDAMNEKDGETKKMGYHQQMFDDSLWDEPDEYTGNSYKNRRMYMEAKEMHKDKAIQLRELEKYMQELTTDIVDMIQDASSEEKAYLEKKISALATKVGQMK